jgi:hypothetical protein
MIKTFAAVSIAVASLALGGCSTLSEYGSYQRQELRNEQGHVIGHKQLMRHAQTGEVIAQVALYMPFADSNGEIIGYEEPVKDGSILRSLDGRSMGGRFTDLRSRATNSKGKGLVVMFRQPDAPQVASVMPKSVPGAMQLMASLSASDLRRIQ